MKLNKLMIALVVMMSSFTAFAQVQVAENGTASNEMPIGADVVATVGAKEFTDINAAFEAADGKVVTILQDLELTETILVEFDYDITVKGKGRTIRFVDVETGFQVESGALLTLGEELTIIGAGAEVCPLSIADASVISAANITTTSDNSCSPIMHKSGSATLTINGGTISAGNPAVAAIAWDYAGTLTVNEGAVVQGRSAIYLTRGSLVINGGDFKGVDAALVVETAGGKKGVGAVAIYGGTFISEGDAAIVSRSTNVDVAPVDDFVFGGTFSSNVEELVALGRKVQDNGDGTYGIVVDEMVTAVAQIGTRYYTSFADAIAALNTTDELVLLEDITLTETVVLDTKSVTINLNGHTVTANCRKAFEVWASTVIKNGAIHAENRCVDTRRDVSLTLEELNLKATSMKHGNPQPITIGGYDNGTIVDMSNVTVEFAENCPGYSIISFVKTNLTATECQFTNVYNVLYAREDNASGSEFTFNNCHMYANSPAYADSNWFALIVIRANNVAVNVNGGTLHAVGQVSVLNLHGCSASNSSENIYAEGCTVKLSADTQVDGDLLLEAKENISKNTIVMPASEAYIAQLKAENFWVKDNGNGTVTPVKNVAFVDGDFAYTNEDDLENMDVTYTREFSKSGVWNAVFFPFEVALSEAFLQKYEVAEWTDVLTTVNGNVLEAWTIELTKIKDTNAVLQANHPYFILAKTDTDKVLDLDLKNVTLYGADFDNQQTKTVDGVMTCTMSGNYKRLTGADLDNAWVVSASGSWIHAGGMNPFRVLMTRQMIGSVVAPESTSSTMRVIIREPNGTTAVEEVVVNTHQDNETYDLQGRSVVNPTKGGVYIVNGKKVVKK